MQRQVISKRQLKDIIAQPNLWHKGVCMTVLKSATQFVSLGDFFVLTFLDLIRQLKKKVADFAKQ